MRIVFMGTPDFAAASLKKLIDEKRDVVGVFTQPDKPKGRGMELAASPVKVLALENGIPVYQPVKMRDGTALEMIKALEPDILVVVAYGRILPDDILAVPEYGAINVHGSLLPKYRGAAPCPTDLTFCTLHRPADCKHLSCTAHRQSLKRGLLSTILCLWILFR